MLPLGAKVFHTGHGEGQVIGHNQAKEDKYFAEKPKEATDILTTAGLISALAASFYTGDVYPNVVQFKSGYKDVYADNEVTVIN